MPNLTLTIPAWPNGESIPERYAAGTLGADGAVGFGANISPPLAWSGVPAGTASLALICHDFDVPSRPDDVNQPDREVPASLPRIDFFHWLLIDLPPALSGLPEGAFSQGFVARGKPGPAAQPLVAVPGLAAGHGARQGLNDYTGWFASDPERSGAYYGYDGPFPPFNDSLVHHYVFTLYALNVARLPIEGGFDGAALRAALADRVIESATWSGTYTLNRRLRGSA